MVRLLIRIFCALIFYIALAKVYNFTVERNPSPSLTAFYVIFPLSYVTLGFVFLLGVKTKRRLYQFFTYLSACFITVIPIFAVTIIWMMVMGFALEGAYESDDPLSDFSISLIAILPIPLLISVIAFLVSKIGTGKSNQIDKV